MVLKVILDLLVQKAKKVKQVIQELQDPQVLRVKLEQLVPQVQKDRKAN